VDLRTTLNPTLVAPSGFDPTMDPPHAPPAEVFAHIVPSGDVQRAIAEFIKANPLPFKHDDFPTLVALNSWWTCTTRAFPLSFIPPEFQTAVLLRALLTCQVFSEAFNLAGMPTVTNLNPTGLYQLCLSLFDLHAERTNTLFTLTHLKCSSSSATHVKNYVDKFFRLASLSTNLLAQPVPEDLLRVMLVCGCPPKLRKALLKNPAVCTLEQTRRHMLLVAGPLAQNLQIATIPRPEPMELDAVSTDRPKGPLSEAEKRRRKERGSFLYCDSMTHHVGKCPLLRARDAAAASGPQKRRFRLNHIEDADHAEAQGNA